jgi:hypothetical protein
MKDAAKRGIAATAAKARPAPPRHTLPPSDWLARKPPVRSGPHPHTDPVAPSDPRRRHQQSLAQLLPSAMIAASPPCAGSAIAARRNSKLAGDDVSRSVDSLMINVTLRRQFPVLAMNAARAGKVPRTSEPKRGEAGVRPSGTERCCHWYKGAVAGREVISPAKPACNFEHVPVPGSARLREQAGGAQPAGRTGAWAHAPAATSDASGVGQKPDRGGR